LIAGLRSALLRRSIVAVGAAALALTLTAGPAFAHFCYREFKTQQAMSAARSEAWLTAEDWLEFLPFVRAELEAEFGAGGTACADEIEDFLQGTIDDGAHRLFLGPGLLAGGTLMNGKGNTPDHIGYLVTLPACATIFAGGA
jgi:hypothetical protein